MARFNFDFAFGFLLGILMMIVVFVGVSAQDNNASEFIENCNDEFGEYAWFVAPLNKSRNKYHCLPFTYIDDVHRNALEGINEMEP